jgi:enoyl-CoA hydratase/carnithine racemase
LREFYSPTDKSGIGHESAKARKNLRYSSFRVFAFPWQITLMHTIFETDGPLAFLTFNRPEARNAMTWEMYEALVDACDRVDRDAALRVLILRGAGGKAFVAGTDIAQFQNFNDREDGLKYEERLDRVTKPTVAQVQGVAAGGGCAIAFTCDLRVATPDARFGIPVARTLGNCLSGATYGRLLDLMNPGTVKDLLFTGRLIAGDEAKALGLVTRLVAADDLDRTVRALANEIAANAPLTLRATKEMVRRVLAKRRLAAGEDADIVEMCYTSRDFREGVTSFLEKRKPVWSGT